MEYMTVQEAAEKWQVSLRLVQRLCVTGRVKGARKFGGAWAIPADTDKPEDLRGRHRPGGLLHSVCEKQ